MEPGTDQFRPPYMSFQTFWNFIGELASKPLPPQIDRSLMSSKSGTDQANLTAALIAFGLMSQDGTASDRLKRLAATDEDGRKPILADIVREYYPRALATSEANATENALHDVFKDDYDLKATETRRKCITFFLHALRVAGLPVSPHFRQTRAGSGAPGAPKAKKPSTRKRPETNNGSSSTPKDPAAGSQGGNGGTGEVVVVDLGDAGRVTVNVDVRWLQLSEENFVALRKAVGDLKALAAANQGGES